MAKYIVKEDKLITEFIGSLLKAIVKKKSTKLVKVLAKDPVLRKHIKAADDIGKKIQAHIDQRKKDDPELAAMAKEELPQLKVMLGGYRVPTGEGSWVDIAYIGRSGNIFSNWLKGKDISEYLFNINNAYPPTYKNPHGQPLELPVAPITKEEDFWCEHETHTVELALGCKFNCSFCGYDSTSRAILARKD